MFLPMQSPNKKIRRIPKRRICINITYLPHPICPEHLFYPLQSVNDPYHKQHWKGSSLLNAVSNNVKYAIISEFDSIRIPRKAYLITCMPSRISTFLGFAEDLQQRRGLKSIQQLTNHLKQSRKYKGNTFIKKICP